MRRRVSIGMVCFLGVLAFGGSAAQAGTGFTILDTLGGAPPTQTFSVFGTAGSTIGPTSYTGPRFTLAKRTTITEIGGFMNNCKSIVLGVPQCPDTRPFLVQIRPALAGGPDPSTVLATFQLSNDANPLVISYESAAPMYTLDAGTYYALFVPQGTDEGYILGNTSSGYRAGVPIVGTFNPVTGSTSTEQVPTAVRILGTNSTAAPLFADSFDSGSWNSAYTLKPSPANTSFVLQSAITDNASPGAPELHLQGGATSDNNFVQVTIPASYTVFVKLSLYVKSITTGSTTLSSLLVDGSHNTARLILTETGRLQLTGGPGVNLLPLPTVASGALQPRAWHTVQYEITSDPTAHTAFGQLWVDGVSQGTSAASPIAAAMQIKQVNLGDNRTSLLPTSDVVMDDWAISRHPIG
jgi:hypothetical protein